LPGIDIKNGAITESHTYFIELLTDALRIEKGLTLSLDKISAGVAVKLFLKASVAGHKIKLNFFNLSVF